MDSPTSRAADITTATIGGGLTSAAVAALAEKLSGGDILRAAVEGGLAVPLAAGWSWAVERFRPFARRLENVAEHLKARNIDLNALRESAAFQNVVFEATRIAIRDGREAKRTLLANAIINAAVDGPPDVNRAAMLMRLVDELTPAHVRLLGLVLDPHKWCVETRARSTPVGNPYLREWIAHCLPGELPDVMLLQAWEDLRRNALIRDPFDSVDGKHSIPPYGMAIQFLAFLRAPNPSLPPENCD